MSGFKMMKIVWHLFLAIASMLHPQTSISTSAPEFAVLPALDVAMLGLTANIGKFSLILFWGVWVALLYMFPILSITGMLGLWMSQVG